MADLTVLSSLEPVPVYPILSKPQFSTYNLRLQSNAAASSSRVQLVPERKHVPLKLHLTTQEEPSPSPSPHEDNNGLSPIPRRRSRRHRPSRSRSAPPERTRFVAEDISLPPTATRHATSPGFIRERGFSSSTFGTAHPSSVATSWSYGSQTRGGELLKPPPPLHRPTTFWRRTPRSGVTSSSYSPSTHLIRRSTFIAAGLSFDNPMCDMSALGVESRIKSEQKGPVRQDFWEVVV